MICYRAPAKMILSGEHSVVYGKPAFVSSINCHLMATAQFSDHPPEEHQLIISTVKRYLQKKSISFSPNPIHLSIQSEVPLGRGLGSSAAYAVAGVAAVFHLLSENAPDKQLVNSIAYTIEKHFHTNPSGVDVSASCYGGLIYFRKEFEFLKTISVLPYKIPSVISDHLYLIDSGTPPESTATMVEQVGKNYNVNPVKTAEYLNQIEKSTKRMVIAIVKEDKKMFEQCIRENQELLVQLGVVSQHTQRLLSSLEPYGVGKVTGAGGATGGSGYLMFCSRNNHKLEAFLEHNNISWFKVIIDTQGVMIARES